MTFKHKLSSRLALLKDRVVLASLAGLVTAAIVACELPVRATDPGSTIADLLVSPKTLTLRQNATADFTAVGFMSTGDSASVAVSWSVTAGSIIDTSSNGKRHYGHYKAGPNPGQFKVVATGSPGGVSDTAVVTVTVAPVSAVSVAPTAATILVGATTQLQATTTDSIGNVLTGRTVTWASNNSAVTVGGDRASRSDRAAVSHAQGRERECAAGSHRDVGQHQHHGRHGERPGARDREGRRLGDHHGDERRTERQRGHHGDRGAGGHGNGLPGGGGGPARANRAADRDHQGCERQHTDRTYGDVGEQ